MLKAKKKKFKIILIIVLSVVLVIAVLIGSISGNLIEFDSDDFFYIEDIMTKNATAKHYVLQESDNEDEEEKYEEEEILISKNEVETGIEKRKYSEIIFSIDKEYLENKMILSDLGFYVDFDLEPNEKIEVEFELEIKTINNMSFQPILQKKTLSNIKTEGEEIEEENSEDPNTIKFENIYNGVSMATIDKIILRIDCTKLSRKKDWSFNSMQLGVKH